MIWRVILRRQPDLQDAWWGSASYAGRINASGGRASLVVACICTVAGPDVQRRNPRRPALQLPMMGARRAARGATGSRVPLLEPATRRPRLGAEDAAQHLAYRSVVELRPAAASHCC
jgi:hypothetical protein